MNHKSVKKTVCLLLSTALVCGCMAGCAPAGTQTYHKTETCFDTVITVTVYDARQASLIDDCFAIAKHYEDLFSRTIENSDISRINAAGGAFVTVDADTVKLIEEGLRYCEISDGRFDLTTGALSDLWHVTDNPGIVPSESDIAAALDTIGYKNLSVNGNQIALTKAGALLDTGGIAKGYIADRMKDYLTKKGVTSATIDLGGNVLTIGKKPDGEKYVIGIQKPFDDKNQPIGAVEIEDQTVVTSGIYERFFEADGQIYHHILDTSTGYPVDNGLIGVTVICDRSVDGDGLSTTCLSLGLTEGMELIERLPDTEAIFITDDYALHKSSGIGTKIPFTEW